DPRVAGDEASRGTVTPGRLPAGEPQHRQTCERAEDRPADDAEPGGERRGALDLRILAPVPEHHRVLRGEARPARGIRAHELPGPLTPVARALPRAEIEALHAAQVRAAVAARAAVEVIGGLELERRHFPGDDHRAPRGLRVVSDPEVVAEVVRVR